MSGGFSFPPPPPPPPKPQAEQQQYSEQSRGNGRGRGRGRGGPRGNSDSNGRGRGGGRGSGHFNASGNPQDRNGAWQSNQYQDGSQPNWTSGSSGPSQGYGFQNARPGSGYGNHATQAGSPPRTVAGHKRKADALRGPQTERAKKPAPLTAPAIPSFGGPILPVKPAAPPATGSGSGTNEPKAKPAGRGLGLLPMADDAKYEDSESEDDKDIDEEAMYAELGDKLTFEHNGVVMSLKSHADLEAWKKERQRNWPTSARMSARDEERQRIGVERRRLLAGAEALQRPAQIMNVRSRSKRFQTTSASQGNNIKADSEHEMAQHDEVAFPPGGIKVKSCDIKVKAEPLDDAGQQKLDRAQQLAELRKKVAASEAKNREARDRLERSHHELSILEKARSDTATAQPLQDAAVKLEQQHDEDATANVKAAALGVDGYNEDSEEATQEFSSSEVSSDSSSEAESDFDDGAAEEVGPKHPPPLAPDSDSDDSAPDEVASKPPAVAAQASERPECRYFAASGHCRDGDACRFRHVQRPQRVVQQDAKPQQKKTEPFSSGEQREKMTILQRLMEQEQAGADRLALQVIKYLGKAGLFSEEDGQVAD